jgi:hypothetical protein
MSGRNPQQLYLALLAIGVSCVLMLWGTLSPPWPKILEATLYLSCFALLYQCQVWRSAMTALSKQQRWLVAGLFLAMIVAQLRDRHWQTFPFLPWNMYHNRYTEAPEFLELVGIDEAGQEHVIPVNDVFGSQHRTTLWRLFSLWKQSLRNEQDARRKYLALLQAITTEYMRKNHVNLTHLTVMHCGLPRPEPGKALPMSRHEVGHFAIN